MDMTLEQYITNPMGKKNAVLNATARESIRSNYTNKFGAILLRENGKINYKFYYDSKNNTYWAHIKVPSEVVPKFYYDVVFKFYTNADISDGGQNLTKYFVHFYSNDPAFVFTYAHVFNDNKIFISELISKMSRKAIKKPPKEKNPNEVVGYVKAIYFGYLFLKDKGYLNEKKFKAESTSFNLRQLLSEVEDADSKVAARQEEGEKIQKKKKSTTPKNNSSRNTQKPFAPLNNILKIKNTPKISAPRKQINSSPIKNPQLKTRNTKRK